MSKKPNSFKNKSINRKMGVLRLYCGRILNYYARWIQTLIPAVLTPKDLLSFNYKTYTTPPVVDYFASENWIYSGFSFWEESLLNEAGVSLNSHKKVLVVFCGTGRICLELGHREFEVTGVDFNKKFIELARNLAIQNGLKLNYLLQNISNLQIDNNSYDCCICPYLMYGTIPTKKLRIKMLKKMYTYLNKNGVLIFDIMLLAKLSSLAKLAYRINKVVAFLTLGNFEYQIGDIVKNSEFYHFF